MNCIICGGHSRGTYCPAHLVTAAQQERGPRRPGRTPYQAKSSTSRAGAVAAAPAAPTQRDRIVAFVRDSGRDWTRSELVQEMGMPVNVITARVKDALTDYYRGGVLQRRRDLSVAGLRQCAVTGYLVEALAYLPYEDWRSGVLHGVD